MTLIHQNRAAARMWFQIYAAGLRTFTFFTGARESVINAVHHDPDLTSQQQEALEELYIAFRDVTREHRRTTN